MRRCASNPFNTGVRVTLDRFKSFLLEQAGILPSDIASILRDDYLFLRRVEHYLQLLEDRQIHAIPQDQAQLTALSKRALGEKTSSSEFMSKLQAAQDRIHKIYSDYLV